MRTIFVTVISIILMAGFTGCDSGGGDDIIDPDVMYSVEGDWMTNRIHPEAELPYPLRITKLDDTHYTVRMWSCGDTLHSGTRTGNALTFSEVPPITLTFTDATHFVMTRESAPDYAGVKCIGDCLYCD